MSKEEKPLGQPLSERELTRKLIAKVYDEISNFHFGDTKIDERINGKAIIFGDSQEHAFIARAILNNKSDYKGIKVTDYQPNNQNQGRILVAGIIQDSHERLVATKCSVAGSKSIPLPLTDAEKADFISQIIQADFNQNLTNELVEAERLALYGPVYKDNRVIPPHLLGE